MNLAEHDDDDAMKVWLSRKEVRQLLEHVRDDTQHYVALGLAARSGLRSEEVTEVAPADVVETNADLMVRVDDGKGGKYRETPIPEGLASTIRAVGDVRDAPLDEPVVDVSTRTLRRWCNAAGDGLADQTAEPGWRELSMHDLRRTWGTLLQASDVDDKVVMRWGGWSRLETYLDAYHGSYSPEVQLRERQKVPWL